MMLIFAIAFVATLMLINEDLVWLAPVIGFLIMLLPIGSMVNDILQWSNHQYIITNWRVIQISGYINKNITDSSLEKVNDVKMTQSAFGRIFNYGDIEILTASELGVNVFKRIDDPVHFKIAMLNAKEALESSGRFVPNAPAQLDIPSMITQLDQLRKDGILTEEEFQQKKAELLSKL
jgi:uncharacterized membrane protein YdbT with pleckstrin-like domain